MTWFEKVLEQYVEKELADTHTALPCRIESISVDQGSATVQPLVNGYPLLVDVPILQREYSIAVNGETVTATHGAITVPDITTTWSGGTYSVTGGEGGSVTIPDQTLTISGITVTLPTYEVGDTVIVVFSERPTDSRYSRKHALEDGYIVGRAP